MKDLFALWQDRIYGAVAATLLYAQEIGLNVPQDGDQWGVLAIAAFLARLGWKK